MRFLPIGATKVSSKIAQMSRGKILRQNLELENENVQFQLLIHENPQAKTTFQLLCHTKVETDLGAFHENPQAGIDFNFCPPVRPL